jgi:hypothetical protein
MATEEIPFRKFEWQKHCLILPAGGKGSDWHGVIYAPGGPDQRTLFSKSGVPVWGGTEKENRQMLYCQPYWETEKDALKALANAPCPDPVHWNE